MLVSARRALASYSLDAARFLSFARRMRVLDLGSGNGPILAALQDQGCVAIGTDIDFVALQKCSARGHRVVQARAESLAVRTASVDGVVCKVVVPYTDEARVVAEIGRVLRPGGTAQLSYLAAGYYVRYLLLGPGVRRRVYALQTLVNTWWYVVTGRRLPRFLANTLYQSNRRLLRYYGAAALELVADPPSPRFLRLPVYIYHELRKSHDPARADAHQSEMRRSTA